MGFESIMAIYIVLLGPPGAGKGTQAKIISEKMFLPHISSGEIFRENLSKNTELGNLARKYINRGELVPDDITTGMIKKRLSRDDCRNGALLDGFPRTVSQANSFDEFLAIDHKKVNVVPYIKVSDEILIERLTGRWTCPVCGHVYHEKFNPPQKPGICDFDGSDLYQRDDDKLETVQNRIRVYINQTQPLIDFYRNKGVLVEINGENNIQMVTEELLTAIQERIV